MHIIFQKDELIKSIALFQRVAANKTSSNLPGSIYMSTKEDYVEMQANDFEIGIKCDIPATIKEPGTLVVGSRYFQDLVRRLPGETIELIQDGTSNQLQIKSNASDFKLVTMNVEEFALVEPIQEPEQFLIDSKDLKELIDLTVYATSNDNDRPIFCGTLLEGTTHDLTMVGTDTHRMAVKKINFPEPLPIDSVRIVIPKRTVEEVSRALPTDTPTMVEVSWNRTQIAFSFGTVYIMSRLIEGSYPDYTKVIPSQFDASAILNRKEFAGSLDRVYFMAKDISYSAIRYEWNPEELVLATQNVDIGAAKEVVSCEFKGNPFVINFNGKYVDELLKHSTGERIHMYLKENGPLVIRQDNNDNYTYVLTPIHAHN